MGHSRITQVVNALQVAGLRTARGYVAAAMPEPASPVAAVVVKEITPKVCKLAVVVYTTAAQGGILCEDTALTVMQTLHALGAVCTMGSCSFDGKTGLFSVTVTVTFQEMLPFAVEVDNVAQPYVTELEIVGLAELARITDSAGQISVLALDEGWRITLTELLPHNTAPVQDSETPFALTVMHPGGVEEYRQCRWERSTVTRSPEGMRRTRVARTWAKKVVAAG